jgi:ATP-dependent helicase STH1/SNF2
MELSEEEQLLIINRLHQILRPFLLRRVKKDVAKELPQKIEMVVKVELSAQQKFVYKGIQESNKLMVDPSKANLRATSLKNAIMQLRKICNHPYLFDGHAPVGEYCSDHIIQVSGKFELLDRMLPKLIRTGHKILIFSQFTQLLDIMQQYFHYKNIKHLILDGRTKHEDRKSCLEKFSDPESLEKVFVLSTKAGGHGLNL